MSSYILDASIIVDSLLQPNGSAAKRLLELCTKKVQLLSLVLLDTEVANALMFDSANIDLALKNFSAYKRLNISLSAPTEKDYLKIIELSKKNKTTVYDTSYHHLALLENGIFLTKDKKYYEKAKLFGNIELV